MERNCSFGSSVNVEIIDATATVRFDRGMNRNAIDQASLVALTETARWLADQFDIQAVVLTGASDIFSSGIDLKDPAKWDDGKLSLLERRALAFRGARLCRAWEELPQITIAAIEGMAVGGSVALALACDWRVAARDARIYLPEVHIGLNMGWGAIPRLTTLIGPARTKRAILLGEKLTMDVAESWGLIDEVAESGQAVVAASEIAKRLVKVPAALIRMTKEAVNANANSNHHMGIYMDADQALVCRDSPEARRERSRFASRSDAGQPGSSASLE